MSDNNVLCMSDIRCSIDVVYDEVIAPALVHCIERSCPLVLDFRGTQIPDDFFEVVVKQILHTFGFARMLTYLHFLCEDMRTVEDLWAGIFTSLGVKGLPR